MSRKTAIVTGSSSGFGLLCAIELAKSGFHVIATMRDPNKKELLIKEATSHVVSNHIDVHQLDVTSGDSIVNFTHFLSQLNSVDVLVNNAGFAIGGFAEELSLEDYRLQFETNFLGVIAVTNAVLPYMRDNGSGRIINMSSISGKIGFPGLSAYVSSKHALEGYSESLRLELKPFGIDVVIIEPGSYQTNIWSVIDQTKTNIHSPYSTYMKNILNEIESSKATHGDPKEVAKLVAKIASQTKTPDIRYPVGKGVKKTMWIKSLLPWKIIENSVLKRLR
jgi:NAD(P)-dependent dehydrogenase (short-subunit alcohol dehydrogenase family)